MCCIANHFPLLTKLEKETDVFANYKVAIARRDDGSIGN